MEKEVKYQDWPESVKITTAMAYKYFRPKNHKILTALGYILLVLGIIGIIYGLVQTELSSLTQLLNPLCYLIVGIANIVSGNSLKWITKNSSWEERSKNKSSLLHKLIYVFVSLILLICIYGFFMF